MEAAPFDNTCAECGAPVGGGHTGLCSKSRMRSDSETVRVVTVEDTRAWLEDHAAIVGEDAIERAVNYARHVLERDAPELEVQSAIVVFEVGEGAQARVYFTGDDLAMTRVQVQGMLYDALRAIAMTLGRVEGPELPPVRTWRRWLARRILGRERR